MPQLRSFIDANNLIKYINEEIKELLINPVIYISENDFLLIIMV